ncbi:MAG: bile acid:sodium symporter family protein [Methanobacteriaceae archaeon]|nr:bile acid:sodium symporter family protein [Methanobacteriaceae archaeon]
MEAILQQIANLSVIIYIVTTMLSMGLSFFPKQFVEPLKDKVLILKSLAANFILVPLLTYLILQVIPLEQGLAIGLVLMATGAGSPFMLKLVQFTRADMAFAVGLMLILSLVTLIYLPLMLSFLLPGVYINHLSIAASLLVLIFLPLVCGTVIKARYSKIAQTLKSVFNKISNLFIVVVVVIYLGLNYQDFLAVFGTGAMIAAVTFVLGSFLIGYMLGGPSEKTKTVLGLGTAIRNGSAALVVAVANFSSEYNVMAMIVVVYLLGLIIMMMVSWVLGKRSKISSDTSNGS